MISTPSYSTVPVSQFNDKEEKGIFIEELESELKKNEITIPFYGIHTYYKKRRESLNEIRQMCEDYFSGKISIKNFNRIKEEDINIDNFDYSDYKDPFGD
ncbi:MAG: hypothetical protein ACFE95_19685 [Candidatus Hodarchaeota archaeon]